MSDKPSKPLGGRAYGSIPHLPGSRRGPADRGVNEGQARICTEKARDRKDLIVVQEKVDGSCVAVARMGNRIVPLSRAGYPAETSPYEQHAMFAEWCRGRKQAKRFRSLLVEGERLVGEWLAQAHGTRYALHHEPFVAFDIMRADKRVTYGEFIRRIASAFVTPHVLHIGGPLPIDTAMRLAQDANLHGAIDPVEGVVWRVEREGRVDFLAKYVRTDKQDGAYLPEISGGEAVWNWRPDVLRETSCASCLRGEESESEVTA